MVSPGVISQFQCVCGRQGLAWEHGGNEYPRLRKRQGRCFFKADPKPQQEVQSEEHVDHVPVPGRPGAMLIMVHADLAFSILEKHCSIGQRRVAASQRSPRGVSCGALERAYLTCPSSVRLKKSQTADSFGKPSREG